MSSADIPSRIVVVAGTYDGVLAGWDTKYHEGGENENSQKKKKIKSQEEEGLLKMSFAMAAHEGSVRCLCISSTSDSNQKKKINDDTTQPGMLISGGFDEAVRVFDLKKHAEAGETKTPQDLGTPTCACFAPPGDVNPTHCLVGLTSGKILLYKRKDWTVAHVLGGGHSSDNTTTGEGVSCLAVHPTGKMALSGGVRDGKICLWDLMKGRLAFVHKVSSISKRKDRIASLAWSHDGTRYGFCHGKKLTARDAASGEDLLDIELPSRINQICFLKGSEEDGLYFVACACDDGSLPVLAVGAIENNDDSDGNSSTGIIRAVMAIEPVDKNIAGEDRFKCIQSLNDSFLVATANSGGVISIMDLSGAAQMILDESKDGNDEEDDDDDGLMAVEILDSVRVGSGARITNIACWSSGDAGNRQTEEGVDNDLDETIGNEKDDTSCKSDEVKNTEAAEKNVKKRKQFSVNKETIEMDDKAVEKARDLIKQAKKRQKRKEKKKNKNK